MNSSFFLGTRVLLLFLLLSFVSVRAQTLGDMLKGAVRNAVPPSKNVSEPDGELLFRNKSELFDLIDSEAFNDKKILINQRPFEVSVRAWLRDEYKLDLSKGTCASTILSDIRNLYVPGIERYTEYEDNNTGRSQGAQRQMEVAIRDVRAEQGTASRCGYSAALLAGLREIDVRLRAVSIKRVERLRAERDSAAKRAALDQQRERDERIAEENRLKEEATSKSRQTLTLLNSYFLQKLPESRRVCEADRERLAQQAGKQLADEAKRANTKERQQELMASSRERTKNSTAHARMMCLAQFYYTLHSFYDSKVFEWREFGPTIASDQLTADAIKRIGRAMEAPNNRWPAAVSEAYRSNSGPSAFDALGNLAGASKRDMQMLSATADSETLGKAERLKKEFSVFLSSSPDDLGCQKITDAAESFAVIKCK